MPIKVQEAYQTQNRLTQNRNFFLNINNQNSECREQRKNIKS